MSCITFEEVKEILKQSIDVTTNLNEAIEKTVQSIYLKGYDDAKREYGKELEERYYSYIIRDFNAYLEAIYFNQIKSQESEEEDAKSDP